MWWTLKLWSLWHFKLVNIQEDVCMLFMHSSIIFFLCIFMLSLSRCRSHILYLPYFTFFLFFATPRIEFPDFFLFPWVFPFVLEIREKIIFFLENLNIFCTYFCVKEIYLSYLINLFPDYLSFEVFLWIDCGRNFPVFCYLF